jgi:hypothetical protein
VPVTAKKKQPGPVREPSVVSYYTLAAALGEPKPEVVPVIVPTVKSADTPKEN